MAVTALDVVTSALQELGVTNAVDPPSAEDAALVLGKLNRILDNWNAEREAVYAETFPLFTLTPNLSPHTIGPSGTFVTVQRPVSLDGAQLLISGIRYPIYVRDVDWWQAQGLKTVTSTIPTNVYYDPTWPNGSLYFHLIPSAAYQVELRLRTVLATPVTLTTAFSMPPGYEDALTLTTAEQSAAALKVPLAQTTLRSAEKARARIFNNNLQIPRLATRDAGLPGGGSAYFDYRSGRTL